jgi:hypothetical protein
MRRVISMIALGFAVACFVVLAVMGWAGGPLVTRHLKVHHPMQALGYGVAALAAWYVLRPALRGKTRAEWMAFAGRMVLLLLSTGLMLTFAELALRSVLRQTQGQGLNSLKMLQEYETNKTIRLTSQHSLAAIVHLSPNKRIVYELIPNLNTTFGPYPLRTNSQGMRDREYTIERPSASTVRIVGIGDSGMWGWGVAQEENYLAVLESNLNHRAGGIPYEVLNFGVPGYDTLQELETLRAKALKYRPDVVIVGWCDNDWTIPFFLAKPNGFHRKDVSYLYELLFRRKEFANLIEPQVDLCTDVDYKRVDPDFLQYTEEKGVAKAFRELMDLGRQHDFKILVFGPMEAKAVQVCRDVGIPYCNTHERIPHNPRTDAGATHFMHPMAAGHRILARHLERLMDSEGWLKPPAALRHK